MIYDIFGIVVNLFPVIYIVTKNGREKLLFCAACYGLVSIVSILGELLFWPVRSMLFGRFESFLFESGFFSSISWLMELGNLAYQYGNIVYLIVAMIVAPIIIYKRYDVFHHE